MDKAQVLKIFQKERKFLDKKEKLVQELDAGVIYKFKLPDTTVVGILNRFNKDSINVQVLAVEYLKAHDISHDISYYLTIAKRKKAGESSPAGGMVLSPKVIKDTVVDSFSLKLNFRREYEVEKFKLSDIGLMVNYEYISPRMKREFFKV